MAFGHSQAAAVEVVLKDDLGNEVRLERPAQRIVTLAPFLTELVFAAGAGARVVGVSAFSDYPPEARALPQVATAASFSPEAIAALRPDLVLAWRDSIRPEDVERTRSLGAAVFVAQARHIDDVPRLLRAIGRLSATEVEPQAARFEARIAGLRRENAAKPVLTAFLEIWHRPLTTISGPHFMNEALALCRAENVFIDLPGVAPQVSWEELYRRDPQVIVGAGSARDEGEFRAQWSERGTLGAVRTGRLLWAPADTLQRPTLRMPEGIAELCAGLDRVRSAASPR